MKIQLLAKNNSWYLFISSFMLSSHLRFVKMSFFFISFTIHNDYFISKNFVYLYNKMWPYLPHFPFQYPPYLHNISPFQLHIVFFLFHFLFFLLLLLTLVQLGMGVRPCTRTCEIYQWLYPLQRNKEMSIDLQKYIRPRWYISHLQ